MNSPSIPQARTASSIPHAPTWLRGVVPPLITPFTTDGSVDYRALRGLVDHLIGAGVHGLFALGSSAETAYLTNAERERVAAAVVEQTDRRVPVLVGCIDATAARVIEQGSTAQAVGADGIVASAPFYAINDDAEIAAHFRWIRSGVDLPLIAYDVPARVHTPLAVDALVTLGSEGVISGVKDSSGDDVGFRRLVLANRDAGSPLALFTGHETVCDALALIGAHGLVPGLANVDPAGYLRLWEAASRHDWAGAGAEQDCLTRLFEITSAAPDRSIDARGIGAFKTAMVYLGTLPEATMAQPVQPLTSSEAAAVVEIVRGWQASTPEPVSQ